MRFLKSVIVPAGICLAVIVLSAASKQVSIKEFDVPTPKSRPHDPAVAPDGSLWYTGQAANKLGRLDPATGTFKEFPLKTPGSGPHGLVADGHGNIWFTAISKGYIGKLNPQTVDITEYHLPEGADDPHTPVFDQHGILWFTTEESNVVGRLDPKNRQDSSQAGANAARDSLWHSRYSLRSPVFLRVRIEQTGQH